MGYLEYDNLQVKNEPSSGSLRKILSFALLASVVVLGSTLAANINLSSESAVEFGQGVLATTACSGTSELGLVPNSDFVNVSGAGTHYFKSVTVTNIPIGCHGSDFVISAYGETSTAPLAIFNSNSTTATIYDNAGTFQTGVNSTGMSVSSGSDSFTATFTNPVAQASSVFRVTIQSGAHLLSACFAVGDCIAGEEGPGGGTIVFTSVGGFNCGPTWTDTCHNLEAAPLNWNGGSNDFVWANPTYQSQFIGGSSSVKTATADNLGRGYMNSRAVVTEGNDATTAAGVARAYRGGGKDDWFLPSVEDWRKMASYLSRTELPMSIYWTSSETTSGGVRVYWGRPDQPTFLNYNNKAGVHAVRPMRSF